MVELLNAKVNASLAVPSVRRASSSSASRRSAARPTSLAEKVRVRDAEMGRHRAREEHPRRTLKQRRIGENRHGGPKRQMHLGVFVLGTGNHSAGWRYEGATTSSCSLPVMRRIAKTAERGKFDLFFISDGLAMDAGDHPSFVIRFEPMTLISALSMVDHVTSVSAPRCRPASASRTTSPAPSRRSIISAAAAPAGTSSPAPTTRPRSISAWIELTEHDLRYEIASEFVDVVRGLWDSLGRWRDRRRQGDRHLHRCQARCARSITRGGSSRSRGRSTSSAVRRGIRSSSRPAARHPARSSRPARPTSCSPWCRDTGPPRPPTTA